MLRVERFRRNQTVAQTKNTKATNPSTKPSTELLSSRSPEFNTPLPVLCRARGMPSSRFAALPSKGEGFGCQDIDFGSYASPALSSRRLQAHRSSGKGCRRPEVLPKRLVPLTEDTTAQPAASPSPRPHPGRIHGRFGLVLARCPVRLILCTRTALAPCSCRRPRRFRRAAPTQTTPRSCRLQLKHDRG